jgi:hypothetical protein
MLIVTVFRPNPHVCEVASARHIARVIARLVVDHLMDAPFLNQYGDTHVSRPSKKISTRRRPTFTIVAWKVRQSNSPAERSDHIPQRLQLSHRLTGRPIPRPSFDGWPINGQLVLAWLVAGGGLVVISHVR